jgi:putative tricarboxylic transport membrane protein
MSDRALVIFFILLSLFICQQSVVVGLGSFGKPGPGLLSFGTGAAIGILAFWLLIQPIISKESRSKVGTEGKAVQKGRFFLICLSLFGFIIAINWLGFLLSAFIFILSLFRIIQPERWWRTVTKALIITISYYILFVGWFRMSLPKGFLPW